ncbi:hypothetical protein PS627_04242 [Pseudomonas fluorescens]|uniref:DUF3618 domain-containing protein n=1 Tax=Pseudomonas fluorescens TaxID=294 RepID=UPI0012564B7E|nr:DUF3618 domain-containing protein [Pseudomonas fluorescens]CAG8870488.1 hypothetical protein PS627_04008 [Pseudomonas fluorescens]CAG8871023.1 hypothetical protein PS627_04242 [Pseudomonas fluorescens]VVP69168.1 hypothetical protein PS910_00528 [Pseudomonas fluorescens]
MSTTIDHESQKDPDVLEQEINAKRERISDIVDSLESRLSPGQLFDQALAYTKGNGGEFFGNLGTTLKNNPVPTALTAVGLAWLAMNQNRPFNPGSASHGPGLGDTLSGAVDAVKGAFSQAGERLHSATDSAKDALSHAGDRLHSATDSAKSKAYGLKDKASDLTHSTSDSLGQTTQSMRRSAHDARDQINHGADVVKSQFDYLLKEQPLVLAALGIALGAAIGAALPSTRKEDELLGDASDKLTGTLKAKGEEVYSQAKETVKQTVNTENEPPRTGPGSQTGPGSTTSGPGSSPTGPGSSTTGAGGTDLSSGLGFNEK